MSMKGTPKKNFPGSSSRRSERSNREHFSATNLYGLRFSSSDFSDITLCTLKAHVPSFCRQDRPSFLSSLLPSPLGCRAAIEYRVLGWTRGKLRISCCRPLVMKPVHLPPLRHRHSRLGFRSLGRDDLTSCLTFSLDPSGWWWYQWGELEGFSAPLHAACSARLK